MKNRPHALNSLLATAVFASAFGFAPLAHAQTTNTWIGGNTTNNWSTGTNWSTGVSPNETNATIAFTSASSTAWTNATNTVGTILASGGNVVIGNTTASASNGLVLATSSGQPTISNSSTVFMYADLQGTNGFTKIGSGELTFRFNTRSLTYTGDINLLGGQLSVDRASSLGNANNRLLVGSNATFGVNNGSNAGIFDFESTRTFVVSNGVTLSIRTGNTNIAAVFSNAITGAGRVDFQGITANSTNAASSHRYTLAGANTWSGRTTVEMGASVILTNGATISTNELSVSGGSSGSSWARLDLGGATQNVSTFSPASATTVARSIIVSNGTLNVTAPSSAFSWNGTNGTLLDMSNLTTFTFQSGGGVRNFIIQPNTTALTNTNGAVTNSPSSQTNTVYFARFSNRITANTNTIGGASGTSAGPDHAARVFLGTNNVFNVNIFNIGGFNGVGSVAFMDNVTNGGVTLRGTNGSGALPLLVVGNTSSGARRGSGVLDLGIADALVTDTIVGNMQANSVTNMTLSNSITMAGGSFASTNLYLGSMTNAAGAGNVLTNVSVFQQSGGTSSLTLLRMGDNRSSDPGNTIAFQSTYNLAGSGAVLRAQTIDAGTNALFGANASHTLAMSNGATLRNASGANLAVSGYDSTTGGRMNISLAGNGTVEADSGRTVTFGDNTRLSGAGALTKTGAGTLILSSGIASTNTGALNISNGVVNLAGSGVASAGAVSSVAVATNAILLISQNDQVNNNATVTLSGGTIQRGAGVSEVFGNLNLTTGSFLDYGTGATGTLQFGTYASESLLTVLNFAQGNVLRFGSDVGSLLPTGGALTNSYFSFDNAFSYDSGSFTITAIPEPSTYAAAAGLLGLMLWPARRRLLKEAQAMLGRPLVRRP